MTVDSRDPAMGLLAESVLTLSTCRSRAGRLGPRPADDSRNRQVQGAAVVAVADEVTDLDGRLPAGRNIPVFPLARHDTSVAYLFTRAGGLSDHVGVR